MIDQPRPKIYIYDRYLRLNTIAVRVCEDLKIPLNHVTLTESDKGYELSFSETAQLSSAPLHRTKTDIIKISRTNWARTLIKHGYQLRSSYDLIYKQNTNQVTIQPL